jgi:CxxC motif-containing protein (DUF1111 family)
VTITPAKGKRFPRNVLVSIRRAPPIFGGGLLDSIDDATLQSLAAQQAGNGGPVSGRPNIVWNLATRSTSVGKFGFKAAAPSLRQQIANAYATDMGVSNPLVRGTDKTPDIPDSILSATTFFNATLAVPQARNQDSPNVLHGRDLFQSAGCADCHAMTLTTGKGAIGELSGQIIHPFTDLLLHDMGPGLADNRPEFQAGPSEWKTTPLWGIGLTQQVMQKATQNYLHDGRARSLEEAILWHGGEADSARNNFVSLNAQDRQALIEFLQSL